MKRVALWQAPEVLTVCILSQKQEAALISNLFAWISVYSIYLGIWANNPQASPPGMPWVQRGGTRGRREAVRWETRRSPCLCRCPAVFWQRLRPGISVGTDARYSERSGRLILLHRRGEAVALAAYGDQVDRVVGIRFDLAAQPADVDPERADCALLQRVPGFGHQKPG